MSVSEFSRTLALAATIGGASFAAQPPVAPPSPPPVVEAQAAAPDSVLAKAGRSDSDTAAPLPLPYEKILPGPIIEYLLMTMTATAISEYEIRRTPLSAEGWRFVQERGRGGIKPWLALSNQRTGQGLAVALAYEGNWKAEIRPLGDRTILRVDTSPGGIPLYDHLPGNLPVPGVLVAEFTGSWDYGSQPICRFIRSHLLRDLGPQWPWVQFNDYYATLGRPTAAVILANAPIAAALGIELFTIDAGWFGPGDESRIGRVLGDWEVNRERFPLGLRPVAEEVHRLGMKFGIWVEIECASPRSRVAQQHPDWFLTDGKGRRLSSRGVLDFGRPEVVAYAEAVLDRMVDEFDLDYLKMDFNTDLDLKGEGLSADRDPIAGHVRGLDKLRHYLRERHPRLVVENCSSGSMRQDVSSAALTDTHWVSDKVLHASNAPNLSQDFVATYVFPPEMNSHWLVDFDRDPRSMDLAACCNAILLGQPGFSLLLTGLDSPTRALLGERIAFFKKIRPILRKADVYHLTEPPDPQAPHSFAAVLYLDPETQRGALYAFNGGDSRLIHQPRLHGLAPERIYRIDLPPDLGGSREESGQRLMTDGLRLAFRQPGQSAIALLESR